MTFAFTAPAGELAGAVRYAARWLTARPTIPAHGGLLFEVPANGDRLSIFGFNENATGRASLDVKVTEGKHGSFVVSGRLLDQLVATFGDKPVTFEQDGSAISVSTGRWRGTLPAMSVTDYPTLPGAAPLAGTIDGHDLADAVHRVGSAASRDITKKISLTGVHLTFNEETEGHDSAGGPRQAITLMATDTYRGARQVVDWQPDPDAAPIGKVALIPSSVLVDAAESFAGPDRVEIGWQEGLFSLSTPDRSLVVTMLDAGDFPVVGLGPIFDSPTKAAATLRVKDLALPLKRAALLRGKEHDVVKLTFSNGLLGIGVAGEMNSGDEEIDVEYDGPETVILMRSETMQAALHTVPGDTATMSFTPGTTKPAIITAPDYPDWRHILVPLRKT